MEWYHWTLVALLSLSIVSAWWVRNAVLWLSLGALCYVASAMWHNYGFPYGVAVGAAMNFVIIVMLARYAVAQWEVVFGHCILAMLLVDLLYASGVIQDRYTFAVALEIINAIAMVIVTTIGVLDRISNGDILSGLRHWHPVRRGHSLAFADRKPYPRWWDKW